MYCPALFYHSFVGKYFDLFMACGLSLFQVHEVSKREPKAFFVFQVKPQKRRKSSCKIKLEGLFMLTASAKSFVPWLLNQLAISSPESRDPELIFDEGTLIAQN